MSEKLLRNQRQISGRTPMPVDTMDSSAIATTYTQGTVQLYYYSGTTRTSDAGQAAGTVVDATFTYQNIYDSLGTSIGCKNNTSLSFTCAALTTEVDLNAKPKIQAIIEGLDYDTPAGRATAIGALLSNGEYVVDYKRGILWGKKATTATQMTSTSYKICVEASDSSGTVPSASVIKAEDAAHSSGDSGIMMLAVRNDAGTVLAGTDGDYVPLTTDSNGNLRTIASGSGGSAGGGNNTYSTEQGDFTATITDATTNVVLSVDSVGGQAITVANFANAILKVWDATDEEMKIITLDDFTWTAGTKTLAVANCTGAFTFNTGDIASLTIVGPDKARNTSTDAEKSIEQAPIYTHNIPDSYTLTNVPNATADETIFIDMQGRHGCSIHVEKTGGSDTFTWTMESSCEGKTSSVDWIDTTQYGFSNAGGADAASYTADTVLFSKSGFVPLAHKVKIATAGGNNDADFQVFVYRWY